MYRKLSVEERQARRENFRKNPIYKVLYTPLWKQRGNDLSPEDVWEDANKLAQELKGIGNDNCNIKVAEKFDDLCECYSTFVIGNEEIKRTNDQAEHSAMMVSLTAFLLLANIYPEAKGHPYIKICQSLTDVACNINGYEAIYEEARQIEDEQESRGEFIEVGDFIEQIANRESPLQSSEITYARKILDQFVDESRFHHLDTMKENETALSRINDINHHCFQPVVDKLRNNIKKLQGNDQEEQLEYENLIFSEEHHNKISDIRRAILPFLVEQPNHIDPTKQNQWLSIIEPIRIIDGLLITHENNPRRKKCSDGEICQQMSIFFKDRLKSVDFNKIPKSISEERSVWRDKGIGLTFDEWGIYVNSPGGERKYKALANVARKVYGEVLKVIRR